MARGSQPIVPALRLAAAVALFLGLRPAAVALYRRALRRAPADAGLHFHLGETLSALGRWDEAAQAYRHAARHRPGCAETLGNLALALARAGREEAAAEALRELTEQHPERAEPHALLGAWLRRRGRPAAALRAFRHALRAAPAPASSRFALGEALLGTAAWLDLAAEVERARVALPRAAGTLRAVPAAPPAASVWARLRAACASGLAPLRRAWLARRESWRDRLRRRRRLLLLDLGRRAAQQGRAALAIRCFRAAEALRPEGEHAQAHPAARREPARPPRRADRRLAAGSR